MCKYIIKGGNPLTGSVKISGAKNAALPVLAASILIDDGPVTIRNCPDISDVDNMLRILSSLGCKVIRQEANVTIDSRRLNSYEVPPDLMETMRSGIFLAGPLIARCGEAILTYPGGCNIGARPIDIHLDAFRQMGAEIKCSHGSIHIKARKLTGARIKLPFPSVGATENIMMAATKAQGNTVIINPAREPEIADLNCFINTRCESFTLMPDRIEAGTFMIMTAACTGDVALEGASQEHLQPLIGILRLCGCHIDVLPHLRIRCEGLESYKGNIVTKPYPGFATDLHPQLIALLTSNGAGTLLTETIFEDRFAYVKQLIKMGADIEISEKQVIIRSNKMLWGTEVDAEDLRGGAALVIAGLMAKGTTIINNTKYIDRGYSLFEDKIKSLGGEISKDG